ncbi:hypothetical protein [Asanoa hainanensis]|uniref:hypothetical protein n=1 Tax=Asanoa hainanensis TaxID=560556 RepID=UPI001FEB2EE2|nr:hypothetical protein [Asanoa hainanensis]
MNTLDPEFHVAVLARNPADPRMELPASEQPCRDIGRLQSRCDLANNTQLRFGLLIHGCDPDTQVDVSWLNPECTDLPPCAPRLTVLREVRIRLRQ